MARYNLKSETVIAAKKQNDLKEDRVTLSHDQKMLIIKKANEAKSKGKSY